MPETWFSTLESVHQVRGRGRWRYRCAKGVSTEAGNIAQAVENLAGVMQVRVNAKASSLIVSYDPAQIDAFQLEEALGRMPAPARTPRAGRDTLPQAPTAVVGALATLIGTQYLPQQLKLPATLAASLPLMQHATKDALANGLSSHVLEAAAVAISMARKDYLAANTTTFMLALGEYLEDSIARSAAILCFPVP